MEVQKGDIYITICDDEIRWRSEIKKLCMQFGQERGINIWVTEYSSGSEMIEHIKDECDILFLDIEMKDMSGIEVKNSLQAVRSKTRMFFITSHFENVQEAFGHNVFGFVTKPIEQKFFFDKLEKLIGFVMEDKKTIFLDVCGRTKIIHLKNVLYIEAQGKYSKIFTINEPEYSFSDNSIGFWKEYLNKNGFSMSMRSILVNMAHVDKIGKNNVIMKNGVLLDVSRRMRSDFCERYNDYLWEKSY